MFQKYHGCGNDFLICNYENNVDYSKLAIKICNRYIGIGADALICSKERDGHYEMIFYNADGSRAPMCGNGIRCFAKYLKDNGYESSNEFIIYTMSGVREVVFENELIEINMGKPSYDRELLSINDTISNNQEISNYKYTYKNKDYYLNAIYMTTHHLVIPVDFLDIQTEVGNHFCKNQLFNKGINVDFVKVIDKNTIEMITFERGVGWTKACGSGACSALVVLNNLGLVNDKIRVILEYGELFISLRNDNVYMKGPATLISKKIEFEK